MWQRLTAAYGAEKNKIKKIKTQGRVIFGNGKGGGGINENTAEWFIIMVMINKGGAWFLF